MTTLSAPYACPAEIPARKPSWLYRLFSRIVREIRVRRALREVGALDDAALVDIGLSRGGIEDAVRHGRDKT